MRNVMTVVRRKNYGWNRLLLDCVRWKIIALQKAACANTYLTILGKKVAINVIIVVIVNAYENHGTNGVEGGFVTRE